MKHEIKKLPDGRIMLSIQCSTCEGACTIFMEFEEAKKLSWDLQWLIEGWEPKGNDVY